MIRKEGKKYVVLAESKGKDGKRKRLGTYTSRAAAEKRIKQVEWWKRHKAS